MAKRRPLARAAIRGAETWGKSHLVPYPYEHATETLCGRSLPIQSEQAVRWNGSRDECKTCARIAGPDERWPRMPLARRDR